MAADIHSLGKPKFFKFSTHNNPSSSFNIIMKEPFTLTSGPYNIKSAISDTLSWSFNQATPYAAQVVNGTNDFSFPVFSVHKYDKADGGGWWIEDITIGNIPHYLQCDYSEPFEHLVGKDTPSIRVDIWNSDKHLPGYYKIIFRGSVRGKSLAVTLIQNDVSGATGQSEMDLVLVDDGAVDVALQSWKFTRE